MSKNYPHNEDLPYADADSDGVDDFTEGESYFDVDGDEVSKRSKEQIEDYKKVFEKDGWDKFKAFLKAENKWGRRAKIIKDIGLLFVPYGRNISNVTEMTTEIMTDEKKTFPDKIKAVRNWISWNDKDGNFSPKELGLSLIKIGVPTGIAYALTYYELWDQVEQFMQVFGQ